MDSFIQVAARALAAGDAIGALKRVALREDPPALAIRGIAMAQMGELPRARELLRRAALGFGTQGELARARCVVAEAEVALAMRDLEAYPRALASTFAILEAAGDRLNAAQARLIAVRRFLLLGRLNDAAAALKDLDPHELSPSVMAVVELATAELALRCLCIGPAREALGRAQHAAARSGIPALISEVADSRAVLSRPAARRIHGGQGLTVRLGEVAEIRSSGALVLDGCRRGFQEGPLWIPLSRRPVLFALARALAEAWPGGLDRGALIAAAFGSRRADDSHRARLRVEIGRLRELLRRRARIEATAEGFVLQPCFAQSVVVLAPPIDGEPASLVALLSDGAAWSTSSLALALGASQRSVQRALVALENAGKVRSIGRARARRWLAPPLTGFTTVLLLPVRLPHD